MPRIKKKSVCALKPTPVVTDNSDSDTADTLATAELSESEGVLSQETVEKKKKRAKNVMSTDTDVLIEWIRTPCLYQKGLRD